MLYYGLYPAKILSYTAGARVAQIHIDGLTNGAEDGITATFAYAIGENDQDTEIKIVVGDEVYIFFEQGQVSAPVIALYRSHGLGALVDIRRIRQKNIEILATENITLQATETIVVHGENVVINGNSSVLINSPLTTIDGDGVVTGTLTVQNLVALIDAIIANQSFIAHIHRLIPSGLPVTPPTP